MEVKMNKEIRDYQESMFFGLNLRQCICSVLAIFAALAIYFSLRNVLVSEVTGWLCILGAAPFAACGFFKYHGMTAEQVLWAVIRSELLYPRRLTFQSENLYHLCMEDRIRVGERTGKEKTEDRGKRKNISRDKEGGVCVDKDTQSGHQDGPGAL